MAAEVREAPGAAQRGVAAEWAALSTGTKAGLVMFAPTLAMSLRLVRRGRTPTQTAVPLLLFIAGSVVNLEGLVAMRRHLHANKGVRATMAKSFHLTSMVASGLGVCGAMALPVRPDLTSIQHFLGRKVLVVWNALLLLIFVELSVVALLHNRHLPDPGSSASRVAGSRRDRQVHVSFTLLWWATVIFLGFHWSRSMPGVLRTARGGEVAMIVGFALHVLAAVRTGFLASRTSHSMVMPESALFATLVGTLIQGAALLPYWHMFALARVYLAGFVAILYSLAINGLLARRARPKL